MIDRMAMHYYYLNVLHESQHKILRLTPSQYQGLLELEKREQQLNHEREAAKQARERAQRKQLNKAKARRRARTGRH